MYRRTLVICGLAAMSWLMMNLPRITSSEVQSKGIGSDELVKKVQELEERVARLEKKIASEAATNIGTVQVEELVVNLVEPRLNRYLRCKIAILVEDKDHQETVEAMAKKKAVLRSKLISLLSNQTIADVSGTKNLNRLKDELKACISETAFTNRKQSPIKEVLFEEFVVQ